MMSELNSIGRMIVVTGVVVIVIGLLVMLAGKVPFIGRLPGDIYFRKGNFTFYFPLVTSIVLSIILTVLINLFFRK